MDIQANALGRIGCNRVHRRDIEHPKLAWLTPEVYVSCNIEVIEDRKFLVDEGDT